MSFTDTDNQSDVTPVFPPAQPSFPSFGSGTSDSEGSTDSTEPADVTESTDVDTPSPDDAASEDAEDADLSGGQKGPRRAGGIDRGTARRIAAKALSLQAAGEATRELLKNLLGSSSSDPALLTVDIMVGSAADARTVGNTLVDLCREFADDPTEAGFSIMELKPEALEQVWKLVHTLGQDISARPPAAIGKAVRPLTKAIGSIDKATVAKLTEALALTSRS